VAYLADAASFQLGHPTWTRAERRSMNQLAVAVAAVAAAPSRLIGMPAPAGPDVADHRPRGARWRVRGCGIVEAVVHGIGLARAPGRESTATAQGIAATAAILGDLPAPDRPGQAPELSDDLQWILAASGRAASSDSRPPLTG
jgi:hypothetical protein